MAVRSQLLQRTSVGVATQLVYSVPANRVALVRTVTFHNPSGVLVTFRFKVRLVSNQTVTFVWVEDVPAGRVARLDSWMPIQDIYDLTADSVNQPAGQAGSCVIWGSLLEGDPI